LTSLLAVYGYGVHSHHAGKQRTLEVDVEQGGGPRLWKFVDPTDDVACRRGDLA
jgi:hypothetical protein